MNKIKLDFVVIGTIWFFFLVKLIITDCFSFGNAYGASLCGVEAWGSFCAVTILYVLYLFKSRCKNKKRQ